MLAFRILVTVSLLLIPTFAAADCLYNGKKYAEGSRVGPLVCEGGRWVKR
jgi:hypothetical protein